MEKKNIIEEINKTKIGGRDVHKYLVQESVRILLDRGYKIEIEKIIYGKKRCDILAWNREERIIVECFVRPSLKIVESKRKSYLKNQEKLLNLEQKIL